MSDESVYPVATTEALRMALHGAKWWGADKHNHKDKWERMAHREAPGRALRRHFTIDELTVDAFRLWWGDGVYRLVLSCGPGKRRRGQTQPFAVVVPDELELEDSGDDDEQHGPATNGNGANGADNGGANGRVWVRGMPTNTGTPPLAATRYSQYVATRDSSPMEVFMSMFALLKEQSAEQRAHEERRSREFMAMMNLREKQLEWDAKSRIAESQARADSDKEHADTLRLELDKMRELATAAQTASQSGNADELSAVLDQLQVALENIVEDDDEDENGMGSQVINGLIEQLGPPLAQALARRIGGTQVPDTNQIGDAVDAAVSDVTG